MKGSGKNTFFLIFVILLGAIGGSLIGDLLGGKFQLLSFLSKSYSVGTASPVVLKLKVIELALGLTFNINIMTILGIVVAILLYRRY